ncbi:MAG: hypothetical protein C5B51_03900 [Terriglobia bacterium]|nr:MAG: hypothetical protein C5B51_03900 [Terriglobia bacterium]
MKWQLKDVQWQIAHLVEVIEEHSCSQKHGPDPAWQICRFTGSIRVELAKAEKRVNQRIGAETPAEKIVAYLREFWIAFFITNHRGHWASWTFYGTLGEMRGTFGVHLARIATQFKLDIEDNLASILPAKERRVPMDEREKQIGRLFTGELQFRRASAVRLATTHQVQPLDLPGTGTHGKHYVSYEEIPLRR